MRRKKAQSTSWNSVSRWYDQLVGEKGQHYHEAVIMPNALKLLELGKKDKLIDLGCGQGILSRHLPKETEYIGIDLSKDLIRRAQHYNKRPKTSFLCRDAAEPLPFQINTFSHAAFILSLQNMENGEKAVGNLFHCLKPGGKILLVLNHPCFRIPRQSSWQTDEENKIQYRRINRYFSFQKIPIQTHPSREKGPATYSFHYPLSTYCEWVSKAGFLIEKMDEWLSDKKSTGKKSAMENRARSEFPLFLAILAKKI
jgi:ubiquinone/menaquinone biosynthesis C-methylase UbiE